MAQNNLVNVKQELKHVVVKNAGGLRGLTGETGPQGPAGATGATGNGIASTTLNPDYTLTINYTNGTSTTTSSIRGATGATGETGPAGQDGEDGQAATITVGTTSTLPAGSSATVTNSGTSSAAVFNFGIPKGDAGTYTAGSNITISGDVISATDTTYSDFVGTDGVDAGTAGLVPAPATTDAGKFLKADGTWDTAGGGGIPTDATFWTTATYNSGTNDVSGSIILGSGEIKRANQQYQVGKILFNGANHIVIRGVQGQELRSTDPSSSNGQALFIFDPPSSGKSISFGSSLLKFRISNLADGTANNDAVTVQQLNSAISQITVSTYNDSELQQLWEEA